MRPGPVLILHNRYRVSGGEERAVELHAAALEAAGIEHRVLERDSARLSSAAAARLLLRGGEAIDPAGARIVHAHNIQPSFGPRALGRAKEAGARTVLTLHNFRLFCAIGVAFRDGAPCFRCRGRNTLPGLALNCRGSLPEAAVYAAALARQEPWVLRVVDAFVAPSRFHAGQLERLGVPGERLHVVPHYVPEFAHGSRAAEGGYALYAGRLAPEKGIDTAVEAARIAGVPLKIAGDGPLEPAGGERLGRVSPEELAALRAGAAMELVPSLSDESFGLAALEAMAAGVPVIASRTGALPETVGEERCVPRRDAQALAAAMGALWSEPERRRAEGEAGLQRARSRFSRERFLAALQPVYGSLGE